MKGWEWCSGGESETSLLVLQRKARGEHRKRQEGAGKVSKNHDSLFRKQSFMDDNSHERETD